MAVALGRFTKDHIRKRATRDGARITRWSILMPGQVGGEWLQFTAKDGTLLLAMFAVRAEGVPAVTERRTAAWDTLAPRIVQALTENA
jgi:hypothetical protein